MTSLNDYLEEIGKIKNKESLLKSAVSGSTFRAYTERKGCYKKPNQPSLLFRNWAVDFLDYIVKNNLHDFLEFHDYAHQSLKIFWEKESGGKLQKYQINKLLDLTFKTLCARNGLSKEKQDRFLKNTFVPLDKFSLKLLSKYSDKYRTIVSKNPSMGDVDEIHIKYMEAQEEIKRICSEKISHPLNLIC